MTGPTGAAVHRAVAGWRCDDAGDWVAVLDCGHGQHVRHRPPLQDRAWVLDPAGRAARTGSRRVCPPCGRAEPPDGLVPVGVAGPWEGAGLPRGLLRAHRLPVGRWAVLHVERGAADLVLEGDGDGPARTVPVTAGAAQPIPPTVPHHVEPGLDLRARLELWAVPGDAAAG